VGTINETMDIYKSQPLKPHGWTRCEALSLWGAVRNNQSLRKIKSLRERSRKIAEAMAVNGLTEAQAMAWFSPSIASGIPF